MPCPINFNHKMIVVESVSESMTRHNRKWSHNGPWGQRVQKGGPFVLGCNRDLAFLCSNQRVYKLYIWIHSGPFFLNIKEFQEILNATVQSIFLFVKFLKKKSQSRTKVAYKKRPKNPITWLHESFFCNFEHCLRVDHSNTLKKDSSHQTTYVFRKKGHCVAKQTLVIGNNFNQSRPSQGDRQNGKKWTEKKHSAFLNRFWKLERKMDDFSLCLKKKKEEEWKIDDKTRYLVIWRCFFF